MVEFKDFDLLMRHDTTGKHLQTVCGALVTLAVGGAAGAADGERAGTLL